MEVVRCRPDSDRVSQASRVAILHAPKTVHTTSQAAITATAMAVDSGTKYWGTATATSGWR
jgi:hypothetical protein